MCVAGSAIFNGSLNTPTLSLTLNAYRPGSRRKIFVVVLIPDISVKLGESQMIPGSLIWRLLAITMLELFPASETP